MIQTTAYGQIFSADSPILVVTPHAGAAIPDDLLRFEAWRDVQGRVADPAGLALQTAAPNCGVSCVSAHFHPCTIDFNVPTSDRPLSRRLNRNGLCRTHTAAGHPLYDPGCEPDDAEVEARVQTYWRPFHEAVSMELSRLRKLHDNVLLLVFHASFWLSPYRDRFDASDCNVGTARGKSCDRRLVSCLTEQFKAEERSWVVNGRIADVFAAEHYGRPERGIHAMEVEVAGRWRAELERRRLQGDAGMGLDASAAALFGALEAALRDLPPTAADAGLATRAHGSAD
ncbi:N-formylglutamate amidohydrolase [Trinickia dinghuensis]|uniref:N-formylglutamate amidohydrolase n=1 Tax=Trinickia dinghuensis TaxID=2291023 RepID=A0A3D8K5W4_9BURK|nr:N-formylglutamate amidohydrolase [Trinickia dinghuensis]RDV00255.1 N-formylglutamate amidohydrolase [Trinickia dinghuensis]